MMKIIAIKKVLFLMIFLLFPANLFAGESLDWTAWRKLPIFYEGRVMPLETFARRAVYQVCRTETPVLRLDEQVLADAIRTGNLSSEQANLLRRMFPDDGKGERRFTSSEVLFGWTTRPDLWDFIPFLPVRSPELRKDHLGASEEIPCVTPYHVSEHAEIIEKLIHEYQLSLTDPTLGTETARQHGKSLEKLKTACLHYRNITITPERDSPRQTIAMIEWSAQHLMQSLRTHETLKQHEKPDSYPFAKNNEMENLATKIQAIFSLYRRSVEVTGEPVESRKVEMLFEVTLDSLETMLPTAREYRDSVFNRKSEGIPDQDRTIRALAELLLFSLEQVRLACETGYATLYDSEEMLHVCPILLENVLKEDRSEPDILPSRPWISLQTFLLGSDAMLRRFVDPRPSGMDDDFRESIPGKVRMYFQEMNDAYYSDSNDRKQRFDAASLAFAASLRHIAETSEPIRRNLLPDELKSEAILAKTAMPKPKLIHAEFFYEQLRPFQNMWRFNLVAFVLLFVSVICSIFRKKKTFKTMETVFFWGGVLFLFGSEVITFVGSAFRTYFTGWLPISSKFETVVLMAFSITLLGFWATFYPMFIARLRKAWRLCSMGYSREDDREFGAESKRWKMILLIPRVILTVIVFYLVMLASYGEMGGGRLTWNIIKEAFLMNDPIDWFVVVVCIGVILCWVPKGILAVLIFPLVGKPKNEESLSKNNLSLHEQVLQRKLFLLVAAFLAFGAGMYASKQAMNFIPLQAVLRSNFWLAVHIIAIIVSYASGTIAWLLAVIASTGSLFGKWERVPLESGSVRLEMPWLAKLLTPYIKHLLGVTVICLAIGTILGGRWADYSWGRFWGWDPKEVWALVTLLFYAIVLHGRVARVYGDFGMILGAQAGIFAILMTWYGVNEVLQGGKHAYATSGTTTWVTVMIMIFVMINIIWAMLASGRCFIEKTLMEAKKNEISLDRG